MKSKSNQSFYAYLDWYLYLIYSTQNLTQIRFSFSWLNHIEGALLNSAEIMQENANSSTYFFSKANLYICTERAVDSLETYYRFLNIFHKITWSLDSPMPISSNTTVRKAFGRVKLFSSGFMFSLRWATEDIGFITTVQRNTCQIKSASRIIKDFLDLGKNLILSLNTH